MARAAYSEQSNAVFEVEFVVLDSTYPFVGASAEADCTFELAEMVPRADGRYAEFFNVTGADPARIEALANGHGSVDASLLAEYDDGGLFEFVVAGNCPAHRLAELGALPRTVEGVEGRGRIVAEIPQSYDAPSVVGTFLEENPEATLAGKREKDAVEPLFAESAFRQALQTALTDRQREVLETAFEAGYYDWPRECTGEDVAAQLDISSATFAEHVRAAERNLLTALFDGVAD